MTPSESGMVEAQELLARYVLSESWLYKDGRHGSPLRPNAWIPHPRIELSVFRISGWSEEEVTSKGAEIAAEREEKHRANMLEKGCPYPEGKTSFRYLGRGEIVAESVRSTGLDVVPKEPPPKHADIVNWPPLTGNRKHDEAGQLAFALKLLERASFQK